MWTVQYCSYRQRIVTIYKNIYKKHLTYCSQTSIIILAVVLLCVPEVGAGIENCSSFQPWRDDRVVEGARLESVCTGYRTEGSNPSLSAIKIGRKSGFFIASL